MLTFCRLAMYVRYIVQRKENELHTKGWKGSELHYCISGRCISRLCMIVKVDKNICTCKRTGTNLNVMKSQKGQYINPLLTVGNMSLFNLAIISPLVSPDVKNISEKEQQHVRLVFLICLKESDPHRLVLD